MDSGGWRLGWGCERRCNTPCLVVTFPWRRGSRSLSSPSLLVGVVVVLCRTVAGGGSGGSAAAATAVAAMVGEGLVILAGVFCCFGWCVLDKKM